MRPTCFSDTCDGWYDKGIGHWKHIFVYDLTDEFHAWLKENVKHEWWWDHFEEEFEVEMYFTNPDEALLYKLTWL